MALSDKTVLMLAADLFEDMELLYPLYRLREEGIAVTIAGLDDHPVTGKKGHGPVAVDTTVNDVHSGDFDALIVPGGVAPDTTPPAFARVRASRRGRSPRPRPAAVLPRRFAPVRAACGSTR